jgi:glycosyltransferase involved in cell wall biosynthesis
VKGIDIFVRLAQRFPQHEFGAVPGWGTTAGDRRALEALPNVALLPNVKDIDELFRRTRVLLMPSLWHEGFGLVVVQAMLRGIPVVASDAGGLSEAKLGTGYLLPVRPIERYESVYDERGLPRPEIPEQDIEPWAAALATLLSDGAARRRESEASRHAALGFVRGLPADGLERYLAGLAPRAAAAAAPALADLSPEKRALLLERLRKR